MRAAELPHLTAVAADPGARSLADPGALGIRFELGLRLLIDGAATGLLSGADPASG